MCIEGGREENNRILGIKVKNVISVFPVQKDKVDWVRSKAFLQNFKQFLSPFTKQKYIPIFFLCNQQ